MHLNVLINANSIVLFILQPVFSSFSKAGVSADESVDGAKWAGKGGAFLKAAHARHQTRTRFTHAKCR